MRERAVITIFSFIYFVTKSISEFLFVFFRVVEPLNVAMGKFAFVSLNAFVGFSKPAQVGGVIHVASSPVF